MVVGGAESGDGIPTLGGGEAADGNSGDAVLVLVVAFSDIIADLTELVDGGVQEAETGLALGGALSGDEGENTGEGGRGGGGAGDQLELAVDVDVEVGAECGDVGVGAAGGVEEGSLGELRGVAKVVGNSFFLVRGAAENVGETTAGPGDGSFGRGHGVGVGGTDGGDHGGAGGPSGDESLALEGVAAIAGAGVAGGNEDGHASQATLAEGVVVGEDVSVGLEGEGEAPGDADNGGNGGAREELGDPGSEVELTGLVVVHAAFGPEDGQGVVEDGADVLEIQGTFDLSAGAGGVAAHDFDVVLSKVVLSGEVDVGARNEVLAFELTDSGDGGAVELRELRRSGDLVAVVDGDGSLGHASEADVLLLGLLLLGLAALGLGESGAVGDGATDQLADLLGELVGVGDADVFDGNRLEAAVDGGMSLHGVLDALVEGADEDVVGLELLDLVAAHLGFEVVAGLGDDGLGGGVELLELLLVQVLAVAGVAGGGDVPEGLVDLLLGVHALEVEEDLVDVVVAGELEVVGGAGHAEEEEGDGREEGGGDGDGGEDGVEDAHDDVFCCKKGNRDKKGRF